ncbi:MAG: TonB family protein, partial [Acidobacteriota bacterium]|nr:TonB family protein [Acidobacteriota bacterium]
MKFTTTVALSVLLHASLAAVFIIPPPRKGSGEMTYYVDLVHLGSGGGRGGGGPAGPGGGGGAGPGPAGGNREAEAGAALVEEKSGSVKKLTVEKEFKSPLRYPDKESRKKVEDDKMVTVVRKDRTTVASRAETVASATQGTGLKTGISGGGGGGSGGPGSGSGDGWGDGLGGYFPHAYYIDLLRNRISSSWYNSLVAPGLKGKYVTGVYFIIGRDGGVSDLRVERSSGIDSLDLSARRAIENAAPFAPLPNDFSSQFLIVHFEFEWEK